MHSWDADLWSIIENHSWSLEKCIGLSFFKHLAYLSKGLKFTLHNHESYFIHNLGQPVIDNARKSSLKQGLEKGQWLACCISYGGHKTTQKTKTALQNPLDQTTD
jgi:hypothetical protein